jgi:hypothetical protein
MSEQPNESLPAIESSPSQEGQAQTSEERKPSQRGQSRQKRGGRGRSAYTFPDDLERSFCRNATRVPPASFPVAARGGAARPAMVELTRTETRVLFCDLLHEGPHMWPDGEEFSPS